MKRHEYYLGLCSCIVFILLGCTSTKNKPIADDPYYAPIYPQTPETELKPTGSIFKPYQSSELYSDIRAHKVGDIITIQLTENTTASKSADNEIQKDNTMSADPTVVFGKDRTILGIDYTDSFDSSRTSTADQSNSLEGNISANVIKVLNNGNLVVRGEKWITINQGEEFIRITGIIRPQDIRTDNTIDSLRVANARIQYSGTGTFAEAQKMGWLSKFIYSSWWPF